MVVVIWHKNVSQKYDQMQQKGSDNWEKIRNNLEFATSKMMNCYKEMICGTYFEMAAIQSLDALIDMK